MNGDRRFGYSVTGGSLFTGHPFSSVQTFSLNGSRLPTSQGPIAGSHNGGWKGEHNPDPIILYNKSSHKRITMGTYLQLCIILRVAIVIQRRYAIVFSE